MRDVWFEGGHHHGYWLVAELDPEIWVGDELYVRQTSAGEIWYEYTDAIS